MGAQWEPNEEFPHGDLQVPIRTKCLISKFCHTMQLPVWTILSVSPPPAGRCFPSWQSTCSPAAASPWSCTGGTSAVYSMAVFYQLCTVRQRVLSTVYSKAEEFYFSVHGLRTCGVNILIHIIFCTVFASCESNNFSLINSRCSEYMYEHFFLNTIVNKLHLTIKAKKNYEDNI